MCCLAAELWAFADKRSDEAQAFQIPHGLIPQLLRYQTVMTAVKKSKDIMPYSADMIRTIIGERDKP